MTAQKTSLAVWLRKQSGPLPIQTVTELIRQAAAAIQTLHEQQIIHQDIHPDSFWLSEASPQQLDLRLVNTGIEVLPTTAYCECKQQYV